MCPIAAAAAVADQSIDRSISHLLLLSFANGKTKRFFCFDLQPLIERMYRTSDDLLKKEIEND